MTVASLDLRSKADSEVHPVGIEQYCEETLPGLLHEHGGLAARGLRHLGLPPLALEVDGAAYTFASDGDTVSVRGGAADGALHAVIDEQAFSDLVQEVLTTTALSTARAADVRQGTVEDFNDWDIVLRAMIDGRPAHEPGAVDLVDDDGAPLELDRAFTPDSDDDEMAAFLAAAGYLHLREWFDPARMRTIADDIDRALGSYRPDDGRSWWATLADGTDRCVRLQHFVEHSPTTVELLDDPRYLRIAGFADDGYRRGPIEGNIIEALVKPIGVVRGISDLPWHKDCSIGRHGYRCCGITVGISVTGADASSGQLAVVAGSHRASISHQLRPDLDLPIVALPTETGDVTVHLSCTLHKSEAPVARERKVMYTGFSLPPRPGDTGAGADRLSEVRENAYKTTEGGFARA
jgi:hypothetical protein